MKGFILTALTKKGQRGILNSSRNVNMIKKRLTNNPLAISFEFDPKSQFKEISMIKESDLNFFLDRMFKSYLGVRNKDYSVVIIE